MFTDTTEMSATFNDTAALHNCKIYASDATNTLTIYISDSVKVSTATYDTLILSPISYGGLLVHRYSPLPGRGTAFGFQAFTFKPNVVVISEITANGIKGTFKASVHDSSGNLVYAITEGDFYVPRKN